MSSPRNSRNTRRSEFYYRKIICEHKQMWSANMLFNWNGRWSHHGQDSSEKGLWKTKRPQWPRPFISAASTRRQGLGLEPTKFKQNSLLLLQWDAQTDQFTVSSRRCLSTSSSLLCFFYAGSLIALGTEPRYWAERDEILANNWLKCIICTEMNSKQIGNERVTEETLMWMHTPQ